LLINFLSSENFSEYVQNSYNYRRKSSIKYFCLFSHSCFRKRGRKF